jgi:protein arginine kinase activator
MLCERCKKNEANVHISKNINGKATELHLCESCARESGELISMNQFFGSFFESVLPTRVRRVAFMPVSTPAENKYAGCEDCMEDLPAYNPPAGGIAPIQKGDDARLTELRAQLKDAVQKEEFERAAEIRDEIKKLESK